MPSAKIVFGDPVSTNYLLVRWAKHSTPTAYEGTPLKFAAPHPQRNIIIPDLAPVLYNIEFWESADGNSYDFLSLRLNVDLEAGNSETIIYEYVVGADTGGNSTPGYTRTEGIIENVTTDIRVYIKHSGGIEAFESFYATEPDIASEITFFQNSLNSKGIGTGWNVTFINNTLRFWTDSSTGLVFDASTYVLLSNTANRISYTLTQTVVEGTSGSSGANPQPETYEFADTRLAGVKDFYIEQRMTGKLKESEYTKEKVNAALTGKWTLTGWAFSQDDVYFAIVEKATPAAAAQTTTGSGSYTDVIELVAAGSFVLETHNKKIVTVMASGHQVPFDFPSFSGIPDGTRVKIVTHGGTQQYCKIIFSGTDKVWLLGRERSIVFLGKGETLELYWKGGKCYVMDYSGDLANVGKWFWGWGDGVILNHINCKPLFGGRFALAEIERLHYEYINRLPGSQVISESDWNSSVTVFGKSYQLRSGLFTYEGGQVRVPDFRNTFIRGINAGRNAVPERLYDLPGAVQLSAIGKLMIKLKLHRTKRGTGNDPLEAVAIDPTKTFGSPMDSDVEMNGGGSETRPDNVAQVPYIII